MEYKFRGGNDIFKVVVVYARFSALEILELWEDLKKIADNTHIPWLVRGDFNTIIDESEKLGGLLITQQEAVDFS